MEGLGSHWIDFHEIFVSEYFFENLLRKLKFYLNLTGMPGTLCEDICTFMIIPC